MGIVFLCKGKGMIFCKLGSWIGTCFLEEGSSSKGWMGSVFRLIFETVYFLEVENRIK
jgi:hypothetical protein